MRKAGRFYRPRVEYGKSKNQTPVTTLSVAQAIYLCMEAHPELFPTMILPLPTFKADIDALYAAQATSLAGGPSVHVRRDARFRKVVVDLDLARAYVQWLVDNDPVNAAVIASRAGMKLIGGRDDWQPPFRAAMDKARPHCVIVRHDVTHARQSHLWRHSIDGGRTYVDDDQTVQGKTRLGPFPPGTKLMIQHRSFDSKNGMSDWCDPIEFVVT